MRVLLLIDEMWDDVSSPNNNMSNWFYGFENVEVFTITGGAGEPHNRCCRHYFRVTDKEMALSILGKKTAGCVLTYNDYPQNELCNLSAIENRVYKNKNKFHLEFFRLIRDIIWKIGKYNQPLLKEFINEANPDIIFSQRKGSIKMCRLERMVQNFSGAPIVAFTGDDEYSLHQISFSPLFWVRKLWLRNELKKNIPLYKIFYSQSDEQMREFNNEFNSNTKFLVKCGDFQKEKIHTTVHSPIVLLYAGKLYCNRWKTLAALAEILRDINKDGVKIVLHIYTGDQVTAKQNLALNDRRNSIVFGSISPAQLLEKYDDADVVLHVEGFDKKNVLATQFSFSTKIIDCLSSGCATMAICSEKQAGFQYLKKNNIAFTADLEGLAAVVNEIVENPNSVIEMAERAYSYGSRYHQRELVQHSLYDDFSRIINDCKK